MTHSDWSDVRGRLEQLAASPRSGEVSGWAEHGWRLGSPLSATELAELEAQLRVELPEEYRSFLRDVGSGGAGPAYGLFPVRCVDGQWRWEGDGADLTNRERLAEPFLHVEAFNPADGFPDPPDDEDYESEEEFNEAEFAYWKQYETEIDLPEHAIGLLYLCHYGCALRAALVVSGPARGQMWADNTADMQGYEPFVGAAGTPIGFAAWYRNWLDEATQQVLAGHEPT